MRPQGGGENERKCTDMKNWKRKLALMVCAALTAASLTACASAPSAADDGGEKVLNIFTWADYFPQEVQDAFTEATGIKINFSTFESNEEMLMKLQAAKGGDYDIVLASDYIIDIARKENLVGELDKSQIPNFANINPSYQSKFYDEQNQYTVPYAAGTPLIVYNKTLVDFPITGYEDLWNEKLKDSVVVMDDARNVIGITLKTLGQSFNITDPAVLEQAKEKLLLLKPNIRALDYNNPQNLMISGECAVGYMFTPQVVQAIAENPDLEVVYPKEGMGFGIDACFVPANAPHKQNAYKWLDFILDGERSAAISEHDLYINCNNAAKAFLSQEYLDNKALYIPDEVLGDTEFIMDVGSDATELYNDIWTAFKQS